MKVRIASLLLLAMMVAPVPAQDVTLKWYPGVLLQIIGDFWEMTCTAAGFEYHDRDEHSGRWHCTGFPRQE